jgi:insulysin
VVLSNKLEAILISDSSADKAAAAMDVRVGSLFDPPAYQGLAHFLEHMLFLGTSKYPAEDEYQSFLAKHGGMSNAFTADNHTCYFFSVAPEHLKGALDRFGQFFISPLFTQSATDREVNAVHSEHSKNVQEDLWRQYQLMRQIWFNPNHPSHHFSTGNKETLGNVPREVLLNFHKSWYSANISRVSILGRESLDELEKMLIEIFSDVVNKDVHVPLGEGFGNPDFLQDLSRAVQVDSFTPSATYDMINSATTIGHGNLGHCGKQLFVVPVREQRSIQFGWLLPEQRQLWRSKPARYLSHILGHEGDGSLTQVLKSRGIATDLVGGIFYDCAGVSFFKIEINLTKSAAETIASSSSPLLIQVAEMVATYIRIAQLELSESLWKEMEITDNLSFTFRATVDPMNAVQTVANSLHYYPVEEVLAGPQRIYEFDKTAISNHLKMLKSSELMMTIVGKEFSAQCTETEKWYGTRYGLCDIPSSVVETFSRIEKMSNEEFAEFRSSSTQGLKMPIQNPFLPENLSVLPSRVASITAPTVLSSLSNAVTAYYKQDNKFGMPKGNASWTVYSPSIQNSIDAFIGANLYTQMVCEEFSKISYCAEIAGLKFKLKATSEGLKLTVGGYSDKMHALVEEIMNRFVSLKPTTELYSLVHDRLVRSLRSERMQKAPYSQALDLVHEVVLRPYYSTCEKLAKVEKFSFNDLPKIGKMLGQGLVVESLVEGNFTAEDAQRLNEVVAKSLNVDGNTTVGNLSVMKLEKDLIIRRPGVNLNETNGAVCISVETGWVSGHVSESDEDDLKTAAFLALTSQICGQKFFDDLRTKQQLGYIVHAAGTVQERRAGLLFLVQSEIPTENVCEKMFEFIKNLGSIIGGITDEDFQQYIQAVITEYKEKPKNQSEEFQRHWAEIEKRRFDFERKERLIPVVGSITKDQLVQYVNEHVIRAPKVISIVTGANDKDLTELLPANELKEIRQSSETKWVYSNSSPGEYRQ